MIIKFYFSNSKCPYQKTNAVYIFSEKCTQPTINFTRQPVALVLPDIKNISAKGMVNAITEDVHNYAGSLVAVGFWLLDKFKSAQPATYTCIETAAVGLEKARLFLTAAAAVVQLGQKYLNKKPPSVGQR